MRHRPAWHVRAGRSLLRGILLRATFSMRFRFRWAALLLACLTALAAAGTARADAFTDALAGFAKDSYSDTVAAIEALAASGDVRAAPVLRALSGGALLVRKSDKAVV